ncbi:hypothetical protein EVAR_25343_1 [Eumeta japonica]|uniref:Uncharacterized protein n=1 Tax=Eumeta variegata TaxID=151549 RepID=A0A4C1Y097_EUMVA|nr:hypothetical protein EVAR_25343_1 [Eumeta japonica]
MNVRTTDVLEPRKWAGSPLKQHVLKEHKRELATFTAAYYPVTSASLLLLLSNILFLPKRPAKDYPSAQRFDFDIVSPSTSISAALKIKRPINPPEKYRSFRLPSFKNFRPRLKVSPPFCECEPGVAKRRERDRKKEREGAREKENKVRDFFFTRFYEIKAALIRAKLNFVQRSEGTKLGSDRVRVGIRTQHESPRS